MNNLKPLILESDERFISHGSGIFKPNSTTRLLTNNAKSFLSGNIKLLDLGCGSGIVGLELKLASKNAQSCSMELYMSDLSQKQVSMSLTNANNLNLDCHVKCGSLFEPWRDEKFDLIISDVSGVVPELGKRFGWFDGVPNDSGPYGTELAISVLRHVGLFLNSPGALIMPLLSLSDEKAILEEANLYFSQVEILESSMLPLGLGEKETLELSEEFPFIRVSNLHGVGVFWSTILMMSGLRS